MEIVRHVDDMGSTPAITRRIAQAWRAGLVDSVSVMGNGDALDQLELDTSDRPLRIAVHLNLSEGRSAAEPDTVPLLVDRHGYLRHTFGSLIRAGLGPTRGALVAQVEREWRAQIARVRGAVRDRPVVGVDGHVHVHMLPFLFPTAARLAAEHDIPEIRVSHEAFHFAGGRTGASMLSFGVNAAKHLVLNAFAWSARRVARHHRLVPSDGFVGVLHSGQMTAEAAHAGVRAWARRGAERVEVLFHIGRAAAEEAGRFRARPTMARFPCSPERDREHVELVRFSEGLR